MSLEIRISLSIGVLFYTIIVFVFLAKGRLSLKYSLIWILLVATLIFIIIFPQSVTVLSRLIGIKTPVNAVFVVIILFVLLILLSLTSIISLQTFRIKTLAQRISLLENRISSSEKNPMNKQN